MKNRCTRSNCDSQMFDEIYGEACGGVYVPFDYLNFVDDIASYTKGDGTKFPLVVASDYDKKFCKYNGYKFKVNTIYETATVMTALKEMCLSGNVEDIEDYIEQVVKICLNPPVKQKSCIVKPLKSGKYVLYCQMKSEKILTVVIEKVKKELI